MLSNTAATGTRLKPARCWKHIGTNDPIKSHHCCWCKVSLFSHTNSKPCRKRDPLGLSYFMLFLRAFSAVPLQIFFHLREYFWANHTGVWMTALPSVKTTVSPLQQAVATLPFLQQYNRHPSLCHTPLSCTELVSWSWALAQGREKQIELAASPLPGKYSCQLSYTTQGKTLWDILFISQQRLWMIFNSLPAWERTKASLCGSVVLNGYKWDCQRQAIRSLSWSTKPTNAAVPGHPRAELTAHFFKTTH